MKTEIKKGDMYITRRKKSARCVIVETEPDTNSVDCRIGLHYMMSDRHTRMPIATFFNVATKIPDMNYDTFGVRYRHTRELKLIDVEYEVGSEPILTYRFVRYNHKNISMKFSELDKYTSEKWSIDSYVPVEMEVINEDHVEA